MKWRNSLMLVALAALWGPSFLFIKVAVADIPPLTLALGRVSIAAVLLAIFLRMQGRWFPAWGRIWGHIAIVALFHNAIPFVLLGWGEQYIDSALASILNGTTPLFTILLAHFWVSDDRLTLPKFIGVVLGFGGLLLLIAPSLVSGVQATTMGLLAVTTAAACYGVALVYARNHLRGLPPLVAPTTQMLLASLFILPLALVVERPFTLPMPSFAALASLLALGVFGTSIAFVLYYRLMERADASYVSMVTYIIPVFGMLLGVLVLGERLTWHAYAGFALILLGVMLVNGLVKSGMNWKRPLLYLNWRHNRI